MNDQVQRGLPLGRNIKIGFFHLGSGMADIITTGVWNRVMISDLGFAATPIGLLVSLRYFLAPLGIWAGRVSDRRRILGMRRLFWIWLGRALMVLSTFSLGILTTALYRGQDATLLMWLGLALSLLLFSLGNALSGSTFLALIYDRATDEQRGRAVGIVWTFLLLGFTIGGILFGLMLPSDATTVDDLFVLPPIFDALNDRPGFTPEALLSLFLAAGVVMGGLWLFSLWGEENRVPNSPHIRQENGPSEPETSVWQDLGLVWRSRPMRFFMFYLSLSMIFAFSQDLVLEPFAGDVFDMSARVTTKFAAYWGSMSILGTIMFLVLARRIKGLSNTLMSYAGVIVLLVTFALFSVSAVFEIRAIVTPGLILLGLGLGFWNVGTLGLMMDMSPATRAGTFLGFWTLVVTFSRGFGVSMGGIIRDITLFITGSLSLSYASVFILGVVGLLISLYTLSQVNVRAWKSGEVLEQTSAEAVFAGAMD